jgi:DNA-binding MarR family transcriptional regulator
MSSQVLSEQGVAVQAFAALLRAYANATHRLNAQLVADHGLTLSDFEVLLRLGHAPDRRMRRVDLAQQVLLTASGVTRLLDGLERAGLAERGSCDSDRRVVYAVLTDAGLARLEEASATHFPQVEQLFGSQLEADEQARLAELLSRLADGDADAPCEPPA